MRLFIGIWPPAQVLDALLGAQRRLRDHAPAGLLRLTAQDHLHLTVRFLGDVAESRLAALEEALNGAVTHDRAILLRLAGVGAFPSIARARVIWAGMDGDLNRLTRLAGAVGAATDVFAAGADAHAKAFHPHITLARIREGGSGSRRDLALAIASLRVPDSERWHASAVRLVRSDLGPDGARYSTLVEIPLATTR